ncbi:MAG: hypothetical protein LM580_05915 [Thermofilum sp.]|jgi:hypothetical protein|nr:hypothetical protein [Thermofilum sp.]MCC6065842.1 hypothetical protein [Thermofilum sp.]
MPTVLGELAGIEARSERYMDLHVLAKIVVPLSISLSLPFAKEPLQALSLVAVSAIACAAAGIHLSALKKFSR